MKITQERADAALDRFIKGNRDRIDGLIAGLSLLKNSKNTEIAAEHDIIYGPAGEHLTEEQEEQLCQNGWHWSSDVDCWAFFT